MGTRLGSVSITILSIVLENGWESSFTVNISLADISLPNFLCAPTAKLLCGKFRSYHVVKDACLFCRYAFVNHLTNASRTFIWELWFAMPSRRYSIMDPLRHEICMQFCLVSRSNIKTRKSEIWHLITCNLDLVFACNLLNHLLQIIPIWTGLSLTLVGLLHVFNITKIRTCIRHILYVILRYWNGWFSPPRNTNIYQSFMFSIVVAGYLGTS